MAQTSPKLNPSKKMPTSEQKWLSPAKVVECMRLFSVGVLTEILQEVKDGKFELVGLSGTSAGALVALMVWYGLAPKKGVVGSEVEANRLLNKFWKNFVANTPAETVLNFFTYRTFKAEEAEIPWLGINAPLLAGTFNPYGAVYKAIAGCLPTLGGRQQYFDLRELLKHYCPKFKNVDWNSVKTRLLIGASEVVNGFETVFDSRGSKGRQIKGHSGQINRWNDAVIRKQLTGAARIKYQKRVCWYVEKRGVSGGTMVVAISEPHRGVFTLGPGFTVDFAKPPGWPTVMPMI